MHLVRSFTSSLFERLAWSRSQRTSARRVCTGGYFLIGALDEGAPSGLSLADPEFYDPATLNRKLARNLDGVSCRCQLHDRDGQQYALVFVPPHPTASRSSLIRTAVLQAADATGELPA